MKFKFNLLKKNATPADEQDDGFYIFYNGEKKGPYSQEAVQQLLFEGEIDLNTQIKSDGVWLSIGELDWIEQERPEVEEKSAEGSYFENIEDDIPAISIRSFTCPHCWIATDLSEVNYIAKHVELVGDPVLGPEAQMRFLPTSFDENGYAIDARGMVCQDMACPNCHLRIPEAVMDITSSSFSIVGAPASGKSYYLTAMIWKLRSTLSKKFDYIISDTDATFNSVLNSYEQILFLNRQHDEYVALPKTELQGHDFSNQIILNGMTVDLPLPFIFTLVPMQSNQRVASMEEGMRNVILYDNAGEHFEPGRDQVTNLATQHLIYSDSIVFLYDPIKDTRMVAECDASDPQVSQVSKGANQLVLLNEMIARIRKYAGLKSKEKYHKPLIMVIPKYDAWRKSFPLNLEEIDFTYYKKSKMSYYVNVGKITNVSFVMREKLLQTSPELVATCESFFSTVYYIPVSALGRVPEYNREKDMIAIKPQSINPIWAEVPMLLQFWCAKMLPGVDSMEVDAIPIDRYVFTEDALIYSLPGIDERETVPSVYWGRKVYSSRLDAYIQFPWPEQEVAESAGTADAASGSDDFWQN